MRSTIAIILYLLTQTSSLSAQVLVPHERFGPDLTGNVCSFRSDGALYVLCTSSDSETAELHTIPLGGSQPTRLYSVDSSESGQQRYYSLMSFADKIAVCTTDSVLVFGAGANPAKVQCIDTSQSVTSLQSVGESVFGFGMRRLAQIDSGSFVEDLVQKFTDSTCETLFRVLPSKKFGAATGLGMQMNGDTSLIAFLTFGIYRPNGRRIGLLRSSSGDEVGSLPPHYHEHYSVRHVVQQHPYYYLYLERMARDYNHLVVRLDSNLTVVDTLDLGYTRENLTRFRSNDKYMTIVLDDHVLVVDLLSMSVVVSLSEEEHNAFWQADPPALLSDADYHGGRLCVSSSSGILIIDRPVSVSLQDAERSKQPLDFVIQRGQPLPFVYEGSEESYVSDLLGRRITFPTSNSSETLSTTLNPGLYLYVSQSGQFGRILITD